MRKLISASFLLIGLGLPWSLFANASYQVVHNITTPLEGDPRREVKMQTVTFPPGSGNNFHRHPGDQWALVQEGEVTLTIQGQAPRTLKAGESIYLPRGTVHRNQNLSNKPARTVEVLIVDQGEKQTEAVGTEQPH